MAGLLTREERRAISYELSNNNCNIAVLERQLKKMKQERQQRKEEEARKVRMYMMSFLKNSPPDLKSSDLKEWVEKFHSTIDRTVDEFVNNI